ncbi:hypothetical protein ACFL0D_09415 [Thermoproteota archaeon]
MHGKHSRDVAIKAFNQASLKSVIAARIAGVSGPIIGGLSTALGPAAGTVAKHMVRFGL